MEDSSDNFLTLGGFISDFTLSLFSSNGISSSVPVFTSPSDVGTVVTEVKPVNLILPQKIKKEIVCQVLWTS
jgi:hypothetical protein